MDRATIEADVFGAVLLLANKLQIWGDGIVPGMTMKQLFLLLLISKIGKQNPTLTEIAAFSGTSRQNVKKMLEQLETKGYAVLCKSETDGRAMCVSLTEKAAAYFAENEATSAKALNGLFSEITTDALTVTKQTLDKLLDFLGVSV